MLHGNLELYAPGFGHTSTLSADSGCRPGCQQGVQELMPWLVALMASDSGFQGLGKLSKIKV